MCSRRSGFDRKIPLEEILRHPLPRWEHPGLWHNPLTLQHPLASVEIVPWDGMYTLILSKKETIVSDFRGRYPLSEDLAQYNKQN